MRYFQSRGIITYANCIKDEIEVLSRLQYKVDLLSFQNIWNTFYDIDTIYLTCEPFKEESVWRM